MFTLAFFLTFLTFLCLFLFLRMVNDLSKIAQKATPPADTAEMKLKVLGLECLVTIMKSLVDWSKDLRLNYEETSTCMDACEGG